MRYQATFSLHGDKTSVPVEADDREQAIAKAYAENPMLQSWKVRVKELADGEQAVDDRATLQYAPLAPKSMGRPSQGRSARIQAHITPQQAAWLEAQKIQHSETVSDVIFRLIREAMTK